MLKILKRIFLIAGGIVMGYMYWIGMTGNYSSKYDRLAQTNPILALAVLLFLCAMLIKKIDDFLSKRKKDKEK